MFKITYNKVHVKKFKMLISIDNTESHFSTNSVSSIMSQSRILEPELLDDYFLELFNNLFLDTIQDKNFKTKIFEIKLPLIVYFFKKDKTVVHLKSIYINNIMKKYYDRILRKKKIDVLRLRLFFLNKYKMISYVKLVSLSNKKKKPMDSVMNLRYILTFFENFKLVILKSMPYLFSLLSYNILSSKMVKMRSVFLSLLDRDFMMRRKVNFRRKNKK